jgi:hypothetical protein
VNAGKVPSNRSREPPLRSVYIHHSSLFSSVIHCYITSADGRM